MYIILISMPAAANPIQKRDATPDKMPYNTPLSIHQMKMKYEDEYAEYAAHIDFYRPPTKRLIKQTFAMHIYSPRTVVIS